MVASWTPPREFDDYRVIRPLGSGTMGQVFLAHDRVLDRPVAIKFVAAIDQRASARERFLIEARAAARLQHPNVATVHRVGEIDDRPYIISEFVAGHGLDRLEKPMPWARVLELGLGLARGLAAAHRRGVLHRDIKPANAILADDGSVKLVDFGLAKLLDPSAPTSPGLTDRAIASAARDPGDEEHAASDTIPSNGSGTAEGFASFPLTGDLPERDRASRPPVDTHAATIDFPADARSDGERVVGVEQVFDAIEDHREGISILTRKGALLGTPYYMAPELWRGETATRRSDVYALGALLYELIAGQPPHFGAPNMAALAIWVRDRAPLDLRELVPGIDKRFAEIVERCLRKSPEQRFGSGEELLSHLERVDPVAAHRHPLSVPEGNPYRGLHAFDEEHRALFFGRGAEIRAVLERLRHEPFVLVAGDSGVGKSSLCRAGVLPRISEGALGEGSWSVVKIAPGRHPLSELSQALAWRLETSEAELGDFRSTGFDSLSARIRQHRGASRSMLIFIDQLEEIVTIASEDEVLPFCETLVRLWSASGVRVLATARGDFLTKLASLPVLGEELTRALFLLRSMSPLGVREAIVGPAEAKGVAFETDSLVDGLVEETVRTQGSLPLLQFTLAELWDARDPGSMRITASALEGIGGFEGSLARHADTVVASLPHGQRASARRVLVRLVSVDETRALSSEAELIGSDPEARQALDALVRGRLVVPREADEGVVYEIAHEALIRVWGTLREWLDGDAERRAAQERLTRAAGDWDRLGRLPDALWGERQLAEVDGLGQVSGREREFLESSKRSVRKRRWLRRGAIASVPLVLLVSYSILRHQTRAKVDAHLENARSELRTARARDAALTRLRNEAFSRFDARDREGAERLWERVILETQEVERTHARALGQLETALGFDAGRGDVRAFLGQVLFDRAVLADAGWKRSQLDEYVQRLPFYDEDGSLRRRLVAPGSLEIETAPVGASVTIARYGLDDQRRRMLLSARSLGATPIGRLELDPGSYVATLNAEGRAEVRVPIVVKRGEQIRLSLDLPPASRVPPGFVFVPPGRFLFGAAVVEQLRRHYYRTAPLHELETKAYLIAKNETTYADWIAFLRGLPPEERAKRLPRASRGLQGGVELKEDRSGRFSLTVQPSQTVYSVREGEPLVYRDRDRRSAQDWLRMPVAGVSSEDAAAFTSWLSRTGRVPNARLCTEREWERAGRGADDREYPHGDVLGFDDANIDATYGRKPSAIGPDEVGAHPASDSPFGVSDMTGNVWEWVTSSLGPEDERVIRGGSYYFDEMTSALVNREPVDPTVRDINVGIRVCASMLPSSAL